MIWCTLGSQSFAFYIEIIESITKLCMNPSLTRGVNVSFGRDNVVLTWAHTWNACYWINQKMAHVRGHNRFCDRVHFSVLILCCCSIASILMVNDNEMVKFNFDLWISCCTLICLLSLSPSLPLSDSLPFGFTSLFVPVAVCVHLFHCRFENQIYCALDARNECA